MICNANIGLTADGKVVPQEDESCRVVLVGKGCEISDYDAVRYGLLGSQYDAGEEGNQRIITQGGRSVVLPVDHPVARKFAQDPEAQLGLESVDGQYDPLLSLINPRTEVQPVEGEEVSEPTPVEGEEATPRLENQCHGFTAEGTPCMLNKAKDSDYCRWHQSQDPNAGTAPPEEESPDASVDSSQSTPEETTGTEETTATE